MKKDTVNLAALWKDYEDYLLLGDQEAEHTYFPSSVIALNQAIGDSRGIMGGSIIQILGESGRGKSTLALDFLARSQQQNINDVTLPNGKIINAIYADFERTFDQKYAETIGVDTSKLLVVKTPFAEDTFNIIEQLLSAGLQFIIIDSIPMIVPKSEEGKSFDDNEKMAAAAAPLGRFVKRAIQLVDTADAVMLLINQYRSNISSMPNAADKKPYGARIIQYAVRASIALERISREQKRMTIQAFVEKTKLGATGRKIEFQIEHGKGIDVAQHILSLAKDYDVVQEAGKGRYSYGDLKAHGQENAKMTFPINEIRQKVIAAMYEEDNE